jgi:hypothetical protein
LKLKDQLIRESDKQKTGTPVGIVPPHILQRKRDAIQRMISRRAYELFELHGRAGDEREINVICGHANKDGTTHTETRVQRILRVYDLPADEEASRATATLLGNTVEIWLPKIFASNGSPTSTSSAALLERR